MDAVEAGVVVYEQVEEMQSLLAGTGMTVTPVTSRTTPGTKITLTATGGEGSDYWTLRVNMSGGSIVRTGPGTAEYTAGPKSGQDIIRVSDGIERNYPGQGSYTEGQVFVYSGPLSGFDPARVSMVPGQPFALLPKGGVWPVRFSLVSNNSGATLSGNRYTAGSKPGVDVVRATDADNRTADLTITVARIEITSPLYVMNVPKGATQQFVATGGAPPLVFSLSRNATGGSITANGLYTAGPTAGTDEIKVTDANQSSRQGWKVNSVDPPLTFTSTNLVTEAGGSLTLTVSGGKPPYTMGFAENTSGGSIRQNSPTTALYRAGTSDGTDKVKVTDASGSSASCSVRVMKSGDPYIWPSKTTLLATQTQTMEVGGGVLPRTVTIVQNNSGGSYNASTGVYRAGDRSGEDIIQLKDGTGATAQSTISVVTSFNLSPAQAAGPMNTSIRFTISGGRSPQMLSRTQSDKVPRASDPVIGLFAADGSYSFNTGSTPGEQYLYARDGNGILVSNIVPVTVWTAGPKLTHFTNLGLASGLTRAFTATGGRAPLKFSISQNRSSGTIDATSGLYTAGANPGTDEIVVTDANGLRDKTTVVVLPPLTVTPASSAVLKGERINFTTTDGEQPLASSFIQNQSGGTLNGSTYTAGNRAGVDIIRVTDAKGRRGQATITVEEPLAIAPQSRTVKVGTTSSFSATGGRAPLRYSLGLYTGTTPGPAPTDGAKVDASSGLFTAGPAPGSYGVTVMDAAGRTTWATVKVVGPLAIAPATQTVRANATLSFTATGGASSRTYSLVENKSGGAISSATGAYLAGGNPGTDKVRVTDELGQTSDAVITVLSAGPVIGPISQTVGTGGTIKFAATGGMLPLTFSFAKNGSGGTIDATTGQYQAGSTAGVEDRVRVIDAGGATSEAVVWVSGPVTISPATGTMNTGGKVSFTASAGKGPLTYAVTPTTLGTIEAGSGFTNGQTWKYEATFTFTAGATAGTGKVVVTDANGATSDVRITVTAPLAISPASHDMGKGERIIFQASGGTSPYRFSIVTNQSGGTIDATSGSFTSGSVAGFDKIRVTDASGVTTDASVTVAGGGVLAFSPRSHTVARNATLTLTATEGVTPISFSWQQKQSAVNLVRTADRTWTYTAGSNLGTDIIEFIDARRNKVYVSVTVALLLDLSPDAQTLQSTPPTTLSGSRTVANSRLYTASGGTAPYTWSVEPSSLGTLSSTGNANERKFTSGSTPGTGKIVVTDAAGAKKEVTVTISGPVSLSPATASCPPRGTISFTRSGGAAPYTYAVNPTTLGTITPEGLFTAGTTPGTGKVTVTDAYGSVYHGGTAEANVTVTALPTVSLSPATASCLAGGTIRFTLSGGVAPYTSAVSPASLGTFALLSSSEGALVAGATPGTGKITVTDRNGARAEATVTITALATIRRTSPVHSTTVTTNTPSFTWDAIQAASYTLYLSRAPFSSNTVILKTSTNSPQYNFRAADATEPLRDGTSYSWTVLGYDAAGKVVSSVTTGDYSTFLFRTATATVPVVADAYSPSGVKLNGTSVDGLDAEWSLNRTTAPDGTLLVTGTISDASQIKTLSISGDDGATYTPVTELIAGTGKFTYTFPLRETRDFKFKLKVDLLDGQTVTRALSSNLKVLHYVHQTIDDQLKAVLSTLVDAYQQSDRTKLMSLIDPDYVSSEPGFRDYTELENSIREQFQKSSTTSARASSVTIAAVVPNKQYTVSFSWYKVVNYIQFSSTRTINVDASLDIRIVNGKWQIHEDKGRTIFARDFGLIPGPPE